MAGGGHKIDRSLLFLRTIELISLTEHFSLGYLKKDGLKDDIV